MTKFSLNNLPDNIDESKPVLYKIWLGNKYYLHKGKLLKESAERFLEDVFRGMRKKSCPDAYSNVVEYCLKFPAIHKATLELAFNGDSDKILRREVAFYKQTKPDPESLNKFGTEPYKPEWMLKQSLGKRCDAGDCITSGFIHPDKASNNPCFAKKKSFKFCPNCGRLNK